MKNPIFTADLLNDPEHKVRKLRGGDWRKQDKYYFRVQTQRDHTQTYMTDFIGFRIFRSKERS